MHMAPSVRPKEGFAAVGVKPDAGAFSSLEGQVELPDASRPYTHWPPVREAFKHPAVVSIVNRGDMCWRILKDVQHLTSLGEEADLPVFESVWELGGGMGRNKTANVGNGVICVYQLIN